MLFDLNLNEEIVTFIKEDGDESSLSGGLLNDVSQEFSIPLKSFYNFLSNSYGDGVSTPILPYGTIYYKKNNNYNFIVIECKSRVFDFKYNTSSDDYLIPSIFPESYFVFVLMPETNIVLKTFIFYNDDPLGSFNFDKKYLITPCLNYSYSYTPGVCWGNNSSVNYVWANTSKELTSLDSAISRYLCSSFNNDLTMKIDEGLFKRYIFKYINENDLLKEFYAFLLELFPRRIYQHDLNVLYREEGFNNFYFFCLSFYLKKNGVFFKNCDFLLSHPCSFKDITINPYSY